MKVACVGLEDFVDWMSIIVNEPTKEEEMSSLIVRFAAPMHKRAVGSEGETTLKSNGN